MVAMMMATKLMVMMRRRMMVIVMKTVMKMMVMIMAMVMMMAMMMMMGRRRRMTGLSVLLLLLAVVREEEHTACPWAGAYRFPVVTVAAVALIACLFPPRYGKEKKKTDTKPTGGWARMMAMVEMAHIGACTRLDIYGFSSGGGKYFSRSYQVDGDHSINLEHFAHRLIMHTAAKGKVCVYGE